jgi:hypothetical protein
LTESEPQKLEISIKKNGNDAEIEQIKEALESEKNLREDYETKIKLLTEEKINQKISELGISEKDADFFRQNPEALKGYALGKKESYDKNGGAGNLPASLNNGEGGSGGSGSEKREFDSYEEMIEWCRIHDKTAYQAIKAKAYRGMSENKSFWEWKDTFDENGKSIIGRTLERANKQVRQKRGVRD